MRRFFTPGGQRRRWPFLLLAVLLVSWPARTSRAATQVAAEAGSQASGQPTAAQLAARVDHHYNTLHSLRVQFTESYSGMGTERNESGTLLLRKPGEMRWSYTAPPGKVFVLSGKWGWFYSPGDAQVQQIAAKQLDDLRSPLRFLLGHTELEKELGGLTAAGAPNGYVLSGVPRGMERRVARIALEVTGDGAIRALSIEELDGARTRFTFTDETPNPAVSAADFRFQPPPGVPVVQGEPPV